MGNKEKPAIFAKLNEYPLYKFLLIFTISLVLFFAFSGIFSPILQNMHQSILNSYFNANINKNYELNRKVYTEKIAGNPNNFEIIIEFLDKLNPNGTVVARTIKIDFRTEGYVPLILLLSLIIATQINIKKKILYLLLSFLIINIYVHFKFLIFAYDNYNSPEMILKDLPAISSFFVYNLNKFYNLTGFSTSIIIPLVIWIIFCLKEIISMLAPNFSFKE